jgi:SPP1 gp7 family putative phage head morphogenesis protein
MKSRDYWEKRAEIISNYEFEEVDNYKLKLEEEYWKVLKSIQNDIETFYSKFAKDNKISISEARKTLSKDEFKDFKITLDDFIKKAKDNKNLQWEKALNNVSNKVMVTRLEALQTQIRNELENLYVNQQDGTTSFLRKIYSDTYYRNIFEIHRGLGMVVSFQKLDTNVINKAITEPWYGENYSDRIWNNKELLIKELQSNLTQAFIRGDSIDKTSKIIAGRMGVATGRARTLVNTESANIISKATFSSYSASGVVKKYEILVTLDLRTSKICRALDGKVFDLSEKQIGVNAPPFHPNCRTTTIPYFDDAIDEERIARDPVTGKIKHVPGDMKYEDWYKENVVNNSKALAEEKKIQNKSSDKQQFEKYKEALGKEMPKSFDKFQDLKYNNANEWEEIKGLYNYLKQNPDSDKIYYNINKDIEKLKANGIINKDIGPAVKPISVKYDTIHKHALKRMKQRNVTEDDAKSYVYNARVMFRQNNGDKNTYYSNDGSCSVVISEKLAVTVFPKSWYDDGAKSIMEVLDKYGV